MNNTSLELSFEDLEVLHSAWEKVRAVCDLYPDLLLTGRQADRLRPLNSNEFERLTALRDRLGQGLRETNQVEPSSLPDNWEITEQMGTPRRRALRPE